MSAEPVSGDVYAYAAPIYWAAGWRGILPLPAGRKYPPPDGYTGARGLTPSYPDVSAWAEDQPGANVGLRMPPEVLGIDVDSYGGKPGALVLGHLEQRLGALPPTSRSTARADGFSGILFFRVPPGLRWPSVLGPGIEVIRAEHRYAVVWPSRHPGDDTTPAGTLYRWSGPDGTPLADDEVPDPDSLPDLPGAWVEHFTGGVLAREQQHADLGHGEIGAWLETHGTGAPCRRMDHALRGGLADLTTGTSRHDAALTLTNRLCWLAGEGHMGLGEALTTVRREFLAAVEPDRGEAAADEFVRMVTGAVDLAAAGHPQRAEVDPCADPLHGVLSHASNPPSGLALITEAAGHREPLSGPVSHAERAEVSAPGPEPEREAQGQQDDTGEHPEPRARSSWWPADLRAAMDGEDRPPVGLIRSDGLGIFYQGAVNSIIGASESGKTWVALVTLVQQVAAGHHGVIVDFEDSARGTVGRLRALGLDDDTILERVHYIRPESGLSVDSLADLKEILSAVNPMVIVLDGINAAMSLHGLDLMDNKDATVFHQGILRQFEREESITITVDHTPKSRGDESAGGIGAQAKRAMMTGCVVRAEPVSVFGRGQRGVIRLWVDKDRPGFVREISEKRDRRDGSSAHWVADVTLDPVALGGIRAAVVSPEQAATGGLVPDIQRRLMTRLWQTVADAPGGEGMTWSTALSVTTGKGEDKAEALRALVDGGYLAVFQASGARSPRVLRVVREYGEN